MFEYVLQRLLGLLLTLIGISLVTFLLMHAVPGGPWDEEKAVPPAVLENLNRRYGLDQPLPIQYLSYMGRAVQGDLGPSFIRQGQSVTQIILQGLPVTLALGTAAFAVSLCLGMLLGIAGALNRGSWMDRACLVTATLGSGVPSFVLGVLLVLVFSLALRWLPTFGWGDVRHLVMPAMALAALPTAQVARVTRAAVLDALAGDYVRTALGKGLRLRHVVLRHVLPNAALPILTVLGPLAAHLATGSFIIETMFGVPGIGRLFVQAVGARDYGVIMGTVLLLAGAIAVANLVVDLLSGWANPRVRMRT